MKERKKGKSNKGKIEIYKNKKGIELKVHLKNETIWLSLNQIAELFNTDKSGISRHISNIYKSEELNKNSTVAKIATVQKEGKRKVEREIEYYNLDVIIAVGYRVNSKQATQFRKWATETLKSYLKKGYVLNKKRLLKKEQKKINQLQETISFIKKKSQKELLKGQQENILSLLSDYSKTLTILEKYDNKELKGAKEEKAKFVLKYDECLKIIKQLKKNLKEKGEASDLFGRDKNNEFKGIIGNIYQSFDGKELYKGVKEKAAHFLYFTIKDHPFSDGNKRIASFLFIYFIDRNNYLYRESGERKINDNTLTALSLLTAESDPKEKDQIIPLITHLLE